MGGRHGRIFNMRTSILVLVMMMMMVMMTKRYNGFHGTIQIIQAFCVRVKDAGTVHGLHILHISVVQVMCVKIIR